MKIGIDFHGVLDKYPEKFAELGKMVVLAGGEAHLITGHPITPEFAEKINKICPWHLFIFNNHVYSTTDGLEARGFSFTFDKRGGKMFDKDVWEKEKAIYCEANSIDLMFDDSPEYAPYFVGKTTFMLVK
jgi:hypothetical protein